MPFYDFKCSECSNIFEVMCRISDMDKQTCPTCNSTKYETHLTTPIPFGDPVRLGVRTVDNGFREVLSKINSTNGRQANLSDKLSRR